MTGGTGSRSGDGSTRSAERRVGVMLLVAVTMLLLAGLGIAFGMPRAGSLVLIAASLLTITASALVLRRQPNRPAARRIYLGLLGCGGVTALVLLVSGALNATDVGAFLAPLCGIVVLVALMAERGNSGQYVVTWGFLGESRSGRTRP